MSIEQLVRAIVRDEVQAALAGMPAPSLEWPDSTEAAGVIGITVGHLHNPREVVPSYKVGERLDSTENAELRVARHRHRFRD